MANTFKELRKKANLKVEEVSAALKISESTYRKYERSSRIPQAKTVVEMKKLFKCTDQEIMLALKYHTDNKIHD